MSYLFVLAICLHVVYQYYRATYIGTFKWIRESLIDEHQNLIFFLNHVICSELPCDFSGAKARIWCVKPHGGKPQGVKHQVIKYSTTLHPLNLHHKLQITSIFFQIFPLPIQPNFWINCNLCQGAYLWGKIGTNSMISSLEVVLRKALTLPTSVSQWLPCLYRLPMVWDMITTTYHDFYRIGISFGFRDYCLDSWECF